MKIKNVFLILNLICVSKLSPSNSNSSSSLSSASSSSLPSSDSLKNDEKIIEEVKKLIGQPDYRFTLLSLHIAVLQSNVEKDKKIKALNLLLNDLEDKIVLNSEYYSLFLLEFAKDEEIFKFLVDAGANVDQVDTNGDTLLIRQLKRINQGPSFNHHCLRNLLKFGADPNKPNDTTKETFLTVLNKGPVIESTMGSIANYKISSFQQARKIYLDKCNEPKIIKGILQSTPLPIELAKMITEYQNVYIH